MLSRRQRGFESGPLALAFLLSACGGKTLEASNDSTAAPGSGNQSFGGATSGDNTATTGGAAASQGFACPPVPSEPCKPGEDWNVGVCRCVARDAGVTMVRLVPDADILCDAGQEFDPVGSRCVSRPSSLATDQPGVDAGICPAGEAPVYRHPGCEPTPIGIVPLSSQAMVPGPMRAASRSADVGTGPCGP
jgi:hypothetical protein